MDFHLRPFVCRIAIERYSKVRNFAIFGLPNLRNFFYRNISLVFVQAKESVADNAFPGVVKNVKTLFNVDVFSLQVFFQRIAADNFHFNHSPI